MDLGCGAGRDSGFLALRGWRVLAVDNMPKALARARTLAARCGVGRGNGSDKLRGSVATAVADVRKDPGSLARALHAMTQALEGGSSGAVCHLDVPPAAAAATNAIAGPHGNPACDNGSGSASAKRLRLAASACGGGGASALGSFGGGVDLLVVGRFFYRPLLDPPLPQTPTGATAAEERGAEEDDAVGASAPNAPSAPRVLWRAARELVAPGGVVFWHHFRDGCQRHPLGHPSNDADIVRPGELLEAFEGWAVLLNDEAAFLPDGRPMVTFIAQRPLEG